MSSDRDHLANLDKGLAEIVARSKAAGRTVRPAYLDKLPGGSRVFAHGRKQTI